METLRQDLRYALRSLIVRKGFAAVSIATLGLGIGATTAIFSVVRGVLLRPLAYPESEQLVALWEVDRVDPDPDLGAEISLANFEDIRSEAGAFAGMAMYRTANMTLTGLGAAEIIPGAQVGAGYFGVFGERPAMGRDISEDEARLGGPRAVVLSHAFWTERMGGDPGVLGRMLELSGISHEIVGVAPEGFEYPRNTRLWVGAQIDGEGCDRGCSLYKAVGRLAPGATVERARTEVDAIMARLEDEYPASNTELGARVETLHDVSVGEVRRALLLMLGAVAMLLVIACANVANLFLARASTRADEVAVRAALGASRGRLIQQFMTESLVFALAGGSLGVLLALWGVDALRSWGPIELPRLEEVAVDGTTVAFAIAVACSTILIFGLAPALQLARQSLSGALRTGGRSRTGAHNARWSRSSLLTAQVALCAILLLAAGLMTRSLIRLAHVDAGFSVDDVTQARVSFPSAEYSNDDAVRAMEELRDRVAATPGIQAAAIMAGPPLGTVDLTSGFVFDDRPQPPPGQEPSYQYRIVGPGAIDVLGMSIVTGRDIEATDRYGALPVALISQQTAERYFPNEDPIGKRVTLQISAGYPEDQPRTIVGVFNDLRSVDLANPPDPELWIPYAQSGARFPSLLIRTAPDAPSPLPTVRAELALIDPDLPLNRPGPMRDWVDAQLATRQFFLVLIGLFTAMAVLLAAVGIFGVVTFLVERRTIEIGVRMALGASRQNVLRMVLRQGFTPVALGIIIGTAAGVGIGRVIASILYDTQATDPVSLVLTPLILGGIGLAACAAPAFRAARRPPSVTLRDT